MHTYKIIFISFFSINLYGFDLSLSISGFDLFSKESSSANEGCEGEKKTNFNLRENYCKRPYKVLCQDNPFLDVNQSKKSLFNKAMEFHFKENQEILERYGISALNKTNIKYLEDLLNQCHQTTNELNKTCEIKNSLSGIDVSSIYSVSKTERKEFSDVLIKQLEDVYISIINEDAYKYSDIIQSIVDVNKQSLIDTIKTEINELDINSFELGKKQEMISELIQKVESTKSLFSITDESLKNLNQEQKDAAIEVFYHTCGGKGDSENAAAYDVKGQSFILICPMEFLESAKNNPNKITNELFSKLSSTIIHEFSHHFIQDISRKETIPISNMKSLVNCMQKYYRGNEGVHHNPEKYMEEILADYWANRTLSHLFKTERIKKLTYEDRIKILQLSASGLCGTSDDGIHPSGRFRISQMLYRHQEIFSEMKCFKDAKVVVTSCTLNGPKVLNLGF
jgi:hypothetical protein